MESNLFLKFRLPLLLCLNGLTLNPLDFLSRRLHTPHRFDELAEQCLNIFEFLLSLDDNIEAYGFGHLAQPLTMEVLQQS